MVRDYLEEHVQRQRINPGQGILGRLIRNHGEKLSDDELIGIGLLLIVGGHETMANMLTVGTLYLLQNSEQLAAVRDAIDPMVVEQAVEELLRYLSITPTGAFRTAIEDVELDDQIISAGDHVLA